METLDSKGKKIEPLSFAKILRIVFANNLTWSNYLERGKEAIIVKCKQKLGALKFATLKCAIPTKKRLADAFIMSRLTYGIQVWGNNVCFSIMDKVQTVQNLTAAWVLNLPIWTKTTALLDKIEWLSIY